MTEAADPRIHLPKRLRAHLDDLFSPNWSLALASAALSYEHLEAQGIPPHECDALGGMCLASGYTDLWLTKPGGEEAAETLLQAMKVNPPGHQRAGVVAAIAKDFALKGLLADGFRWTVPEPDEVEKMKIAANQIAAAVVLSAEGFEKAAEAGVALGAIKPRGL